MGANNEIDKKEIDKSELLLQIGWGMSFIREDLFYIEHGIDNNIPDQYNYRLKSLKGGLEKLNKNLEKLKNL
jgi:hypothetical protein